MRALSSVSIIALLTLGGMAVAAPAVAQPYMQVDIRTQIPPPPLPAYDQPPAPGYGYIWTPGYWAWDDYENQYYWVDGQWVLPPQEGYLWTPGYWDYDGDEYVFNEGYWGPSVGYYGGIDYGFGYDGYGYDGGYWNGNIFYYNSYYNNFGRRHFDHVFEGRDHYNRPQGWEHWNYGDRRPDDRDHDWRDGDHHRNDGDRRSFVSQPIGQRLPNGQPRTGGGWNGANPNAPLGGAWSRQPYPNRPNNGYGAQPNPPAGSWRNQPSSSGYGQPNPGWNNQQGHVNRQPPVYGGYGQPGGRQFNGGQVAPPQPPRQFYGGPQAGGQGRPMGGFQQGQPPRPAFTPPVNAPMGVRPAPNGQPPRNAQPAPAPAPAQNKGDHWRDRQ